jgi:multidrug resistance protein, MATE family
MLCQARWTDSARQILSLAGPIMVSRVGLLALATVDSVMVGRMGVEQLAYLAVAAQPQQSLGAIGQGIVSGLPAVVAGIQLRDDRAEAGRWLVSALILTALAGLALAAILSLGEALLRAGHQAADLAIAGEPVLRAFAWGMPALLMFWAVSLFFESLGRPRVPLTIVLAAVAAKVLLNLVLVSGVADIVPSLGALGAAISTSIVRWLMLAAILWLASREVIAWAEIDWRHGLGRVGTLMKVGVPVAFATLFETGAFLTLAGFAGALGAETLAGYQIARSLYQIAYMPSIALGLSASICLAGALRAGDPMRARQVTKVGIALNATVAIGCGVLVGLFPISAGRLFTDDVAFLATLGTALTITGVLIVFDGFQGFLNANLRGVADGFVPSMIQLAAFWGVAVPVAWFLAFELERGLEGVLGGLTLGLGVASALLALRLFTHPTLSS